jgi:hydrogenase maturation factor
MSLLSGEIVEIYSESDILTAKVSVHGAYTKAVLMFLPGARVGDRVLIDSGVALALVQTQLPEELEYVLSYTRESARD